MEIILNTNPPVKHRVYWKGKTVSVDDLPTVAVYDIKEDITDEPPVSTYLTTLQAESVETDEGVYQVFIPLQYANITRQLELVWEYEIEGHSVTKSHRVFVVQPYTDLTQAIEELGIGSDPSDPNYKTYEELQDAESWARRVIEAYTGQRFYKYFDTHISYGDGTDVLSLPYRIIDLYELYSNDVLLYSAPNETNNFGYQLQISESRYGVRVNRASTVDNIVYVANGNIPPTVNDINAGGAFSKGNVYKVEGYFGWEKVPVEVDLACVELMKDYFSRDRIWRNKFLHSVQSFDWHFEYNTGAFIGTGNLYVDQLLLPYVLTHLVLI